MTKDIFNSYSNSEAENKLINMGILKYKEVCPYCGSTEVYHIRRNHVKCKKCRREWSKYKDSLLENMRIKPPIFLKIIEKIAEGDLIKNIAEDLKISYNTVLKVRNRIKNQIIKDVFKIDDFQGHILIGVKISEDELNLEVVKNLNYDKVDDDKIFKLGRIYFIEEYDKFDHLIIISEEPIERLEECYQIADLNELRSEVKRFFKNFSEKLKKGKIINAPTILYTIAQSVLEYRHEKEDIVKLFLNAFDKA